MHTHVIRRNYAESISSGNEGANYFAFYTQPGEIRRPRKSRSNSPRQPRTNWDEIATAGTTALFEIGYSGGFRSVIRRGGWYRAINYLVRTGCKNKRITRFCVIAFAARAYTAGGMYNDFFFVFSLCTFVQWLGWLYFRRTFDDKYGCLIHISLI